MIVIDSKTTQDFLTLIDLANNYPRAIQSETRAIVTLQSWSKKKPLENETSKPIKNVPKFPDRAKIRRRTIQMVLTRAWAGWKQAKIFVELRFSKYHSNSVRWKRFSTRSLSFCANGTLWSLTGTFFHKICFLIQSEMYHIKLRILITIEERVYW